MELGESPFNALKKISKLVNDVSEDRSTVSSLVTQLKELSLSSNVTVSSLAVHALVTACENDKFSISHGEDILISLLSSTKQPLAALVPALSRLLSKDASRSEWINSYNVSNKPHPFVSILRHNWCTWDAVSCFVHQVLKNSALKNDIIKPVIAYVFYDPGAPVFAKTQILQALLKSLDIEIILEYLPWQEIDQNWCWLVLELALDRLKCHDTITQTGIIPVLAAAAVYLLTNGQDPSLWTDLILELLEKTTNPADEVLLMFTRCLPKCSTLYIDSVLKVCKYCIEKGRCNSLSASSLASILLQWAFFPTILTKDVTATCSFILTKLDSDFYSSSTFHDTIFKSFHNSFSEIQSAYELAHLTFRLKDEKDKLFWLKSFEARLSNNPIITRFQPLLLGILLQSKSIVTSCSVINILRKLTKNDKTLAPTVLCVALYKLGKEKEPELLMMYLRLVADLSVDADSLPVILRVIGSLQKGDVHLMHSTHISLLAIVYSNWSRTFPYLHQLLQSCPPILSDHVETQVTRAYAMMEVCRQNPTSHGKDLLGLISQVINSSNEWTGAPATAIALNAITYLLEADVIDHRGTWAALESKMKKETHPIVIKSVCKLLGTAVNTDDEEFKGRATAWLWKLVEKDNCVLDALSTLGQFSISTFNLSTLPANYRQNLTIPKELRSEDTPDIPELVIPYVPGECWVQLLEKIDEKYLTRAEAMAAKFLMQEVQSLPRGLYHTPMGDIEPISYSSLPPSSVLGALVHHLLKMAKKGLFQQRITQSILRVLSEDCLRGFPPLNWSFLEPGLSLAELQPIICRLCALQGPKSNSAAEVIKKLLSNVNVDEVSCASWVLDDLSAWSQCVNSSTVGQIVADVLRALLCDQKLFERAVASIKATICLANVPEPIRIVVAKAVVGLLPDINSDLKSMETSLWECLAQLPDAMLEKIIVPKHWPEITSERMLQSVLVSRQAVLINSSTNPMDYFSHLIDAVISRSSDQQVVMEAVVETLRRLECKTCMPWLRQLVSRSLVALSDADDQGLEFLVTLTMLTANVMSGVDLGLSSDELIEDRNFMITIYPISLSLLLENDVNTAPHIIEGLHRLLKGGRLKVELRETLYQGLLALRSFQYCKKSDRWLRLYHHERPAFGFERFF